MKRKCINCRFIYWNNETRNWVCDEGGYSDIGDIHRTMTMYECSVWKPLTDSQTEERVKDLIKPKVCEIEDELNERLIELLEQNENTMDIMKDQAKRAIAVIKAREIFFAG